MSSPSPPGVALAGPRPQLHMRAGPPLRRWAPCRAPLHPGSPRRPQATTSYEAGPPLRRWAPRRAPPHRAALAGPRPQLHVRLVSILFALGVRPAAQAEGCLSLFRFSKELLPAHLRAPCFCPVHVGQARPGGARQEEARHGFLGTSLFGRFPPGALITTQPSALLLGGQRYLSGAKPRCAAFVCIENHSFISGCSGSWLLCGSPLVVVGGLLLLQSTGPPAQGQQLQCTGFIAPHHVKSSQTSGRTRVPCVGKQTLPLSHQGSPDTHL